MTWKLDNRKPLSSQIGEQICVRIALGELKPLEKILSVREAAVSLGVNPNTVQRAYEMLEDKGILYSVRGSGWFVSSETELAKETLEKIIREKTEEYVSSLSNLGQSLEDIKNYLKEWGE